MSNWNGFVLTRVGADLQAKVNAGLTNLSFTKVALGDGTASGDLQNLVDLVSRKKDLTIASIGTSNNVVTVKSIITNESLQTGFYMREMGLYATDPDDGEILYCVMVDTNPDYMPADGSATVVSELLTLNLTMSNTGNVTATLDASQLIHRSEFFDLLIEKLASKLPMAISELSTESVFYRLLSFALTAAGVRYNFQNSNAWYICLGSLFGGLIIQGGYYPTTTTEGSIAYPIAFTGNKIFLGTATTGSRPVGLTNSAATANTILEYKFASTGSNNFRWVAIGV